MPLKPYKRNDTAHWWVKGRVEDNGKHITDYIRKSTGSLTEAGAWDWIKIEEDRQRRRYILGEEAGHLTMADAIHMYPAKPTEAKALMKIIESLGDAFCQMPVSQITGKYIRNLGFQLKPNVCTDTMWREVVTPIRAAINNAHDLGKCPQIRVKSYSEQERINQDTKRGKQSRVERKPSDREWIEKFCEHADIYNAAMVRFMFETAARIDQAVSLTPSNLDLINKRVWLKSAKGHPAQWVAISHDMMVELANLPPKHPHNSKLGYKMDARVFGYGSSTGYNGRWKTICNDAGIEYISAHQAGRHGFYTELRVRQGVDPVTAAKAGRWKDVALPDKTYAHVEENEANIREQIRTGRVQSQSQKLSNQMKNKGI